MKSKLLLIDYTYLLLQVHCVVFSDGSIHIIGKTKKNYLVQITVTALGASGDVTSVFITEDSRVFMNISDGIYALEFGVLQLFNPFFFLLLLLLIIY